MYYMNVFRASSKFTVYKSYIVIQLPVVDRPTIMIQLLSSAFLQYLLRRRNINNRHDCHIILVVVGEITSIGNGTF